MEPLIDPLNDRTVKTVPLPPHKPLKPNLMFPPNLKGKPDWKLVRDHLQKEGRVNKEEVVRLIAETSKILKNESNLLNIQDPLTIVGDVHGQFYDFIKILDIGGSPEKTKYLFLGDFVDRGSFSIESESLFPLTQMAHPEAIFMLRGNHECRQMTMFFNFRDECLYKYDQEIYDLFMDSFDVFPLSCVVNGKFLALHGGISPELRTLDDIKRIDSDMLWADPVENDTGYCEVIYKNNEVRGCSFFFGQNAVNKFLETNNLLSVIRAHEAQLEGFKMHRWNGPSEFPVVITLFSAPNYCDVYNNKGAIIKFNNNILNIQQYNYTPHPYILPHFMDVFTWSIPFVSEKVTEILMNLLKPSEGIDSDDEKIDEKLLPKKEVAKEQKPSTLSKKSEIIRNKIKFMSRMMKFQKTIRENNEQIIQLKGLSPDNKIPRGILTEGKMGIDNALVSFEKAKNADIINEKRPENFQPLASKNSKKLF